MKTDLGKKRKSKEFLCLVKRKEVRGSFGLKTRLLNLGIKKTKRGGTQKKNGKKGASLMNLR